MLSRITLIYHMVNVSTNEENMCRMFEKVILRHLDPLPEGLLSALSSALFEAQGGLLWDSENVSHPNAGLCRTFRKGGGK